MKQIALVLSLAVLFSVIGCIPSERRVTGGVVAPPAKETATVSGLGEKFDPYPYLPKDGKVAKITPAATKSYGVKGVQEAVIFQDIDNDNIEEVVVFYTIPEKGGELPAAASANVVVLKEQNGGFKKLWEDRNPTAGYINRLSGVRDINGDGKAEIIAARWVGASFGGYFDIFQWDGDKFVKLNGGWNVENDIKSIELKDMAGDGTPEIVIGHRFSNPDIYKWEKDKYSLYKEGGPYPAYK